MTITDRHNKSGIVYVVQVEMGTTRDGGRDRPKVTCKTKAEAREVEARLLSMRAVMRGKSGRMRLDDYVEYEYWPVAVGRMAASSLDTYRRELDKRILPSLGRMDVRDIDRRAIQRMVDGCATRDVAEKAVSVLKTVLNQAKGDQIVTSNPAEAKFAWPAPGKPRDPGVVVTRFEGMAPFFEAIDALGNPETAELLAVTGFLMGLRPEERYGLDWEDFAPGMAGARVRRAYVTASPRHGGLQLKDPKTELSARFVPAPPDARARLARIGEGRSGPVLLGAGGGRLSPSTGVKRWNRFLREAAEAGFGLPRVTVENMRHSFATSFLHAGGNVEDLSRILGHSDINTTYRRYVRPSEDDASRAVESVFASLEPPLAAAGAPLAADGTKTAPKTPCPSMGLVPGKGHDWCRFGAKVTNTYARYKKI